MIAITQVTKAQPSTEPSRKSLRRQFQEQELITAKRFTYIINPGEAPRIVWRDADSVRALGGGTALQIRWFDARLNEAPKPDHPGRWTAWIETTAPNGTPCRRSMTFYCRPPGFFLYLLQDVSIPLPYQVGPIAADVWQEHADEMAALAKESVLRGMNDSEAGAVILAALSEQQATGKRPHTLNSAIAQNEAHHLAVKLKVLGLHDNVRPLPPPRKRATPAPVLREGSAAEAGVKPGTAEQLQQICQEWAADSGEPFVTLVARRGVIVLHNPFGNDKSGKAIDRDYRCDVASITKSATAILFSQFVDQGLIRWDDPISSVFPDFPKNDPRVPTFRQCLTHMSGLSGHGDFGGCANPNFENIILNAIDVNEPGKAYIYSGTGFDLCVKAMEYATGKPWRHIFADHLFAPLGMGDVPLGSGGSGAQFTARELGILAQCFANHGSYGELEFISEKTFQEMLPEDLSKRYPGKTSEIEGFGNHWMKPLKPGAPAGSKEEKDLIFGPRLAGHGSLTACMFYIDLDQDLIIVQVRRAAGDRFGEWSARFLQAVADSVLDAHSNGNTEVNSSQS